MEVLPEQAQCVAAVYWGRECRRASGFFAPDFQPMCWQHGRAIELQMLGIYLCDPFLYPQPLSDAGLCLAYVDVSRDDRDWHLRCGRTAIPSTDFCPRHARLLIRRFIHRPYDGWPTEVPWGTYEADRWGVARRTDVPSLAELAALL